MLHSHRERTILRILFLLLFLSLGTAVCAASSTIQQVQSFQKQYHAVKTKDVNAIHPWMTIHVVSHIYHVPENYLYQSLKISKTDPLHRATLATIASRKKQPVPQVIHTVQHAILIYRKEHPKNLTPTPQPHRKYPSPTTPGRTNY